VSLWTDVATRGTTDGLRQVSGIDVDVQYAPGREAIPGPDSIGAWVTAALQGQRQTAELSVRVVDDDEMRGLNRRFRLQDKSTNVLSFPCAVPGMPELLGDLVISQEVVRREASEQGKSVDAHFAHLVVHGVLHLLGYDHIAAEEAAVMEARERDILEQMGYADPYQDNHDG